MKKFLISVFLVLIMFVGFASLASARTLSVRGYVTKRGTYVMPHYKTSPNKTKLDNYSTKGNYNPFTGKSGYVNPYSYRLR